MGRVGVVSVLCGAVLLVVGCSGRPDERYLLPDGYTGWVAVTYKVRDAPTFPREDGFRLVTVPDSGTVETHEKPLTGEGYIRQYYWVRADGTRQEVPTSAGFTICRRQLVWCVCVGNRADLERYWRVYGRDLGVASRKGVCASRVGRMPADSP
jgi:hypothetical protein